MGSKLHQFIAPGERPILDALLQEGLTKSSRGEMTLQLANGRLAPVYLSMNTLQVVDLHGVSVVVTDLTEQKRSEEILAAEKLARSILEQAAEAILVCDGEGRIIRASYAAEALCGENPILQLFDFVFSLQPGLEVGPWPGPDAFKAGKQFSIAAPLQGQVFKGIVTRFIRKDGHAFTLLLSAGPLLSAQNKIIGGVVTLTDITERMRADARWQQSEARLKRLMESNIIGIFFGDLSGSILDANAALLHMIGYTPADLKADHVRWTEMTPPEFGPADTRAIWECRNVGACAPYEKAFIHKDGRRVPILIGMALLEGSQEAAVGFVLDISERKRIEEERDILLRREQMARQEAEAANRAKDEFLATISHELRTPLTSMLGWTRMLLAGQLDQATARRALKTIERNANAQAQLIDDLLDVSRIISGKLRLDVRTVELAPVIEAALDALRPAAEAKAIRVQVVMDPKAGPISGDPNRLLQVVWNLLSNAIKFRPRGGRIQVRLARVHSHVEIMVRDTGQGVSPEFLPYVFDRFRQADGTITRKFGGLGLGLAIVRHLVELHGGAVGVESLGEGQGATFTVKLPIMPVRVENGDSGDLHPIAEDDASFPCSPALEGIRVLLVDDEPDTLEFLTMVLERCRMTVVAVNSAFDAMAALKDWKPDLLISDIGMPEMDGYALIRQVRNLSPEEGGYLLAVALTAYARAEDRRRSLAAGFQMHVPKPVDSAELLTVIASLIGRRHSPILRHNQERGNSEAD